MSSFLAASPSLAAASVPSAGASPSAPSALLRWFFRFLNTVGAATVAITKSLSVIVGETFSGNFTDEIFKLVPMSEPLRSIVISAGIFSAGHFNSTVLLTIFKTPPLFKPGESG